MNMENTTLTSYVCSHHVKNLFVIFMYYEITVSLSNFAKSKNLYTISA